MAKSAEYGKRYFRQRSAALRGNTNPANRVVTRRRATSAGYRPVVVKRG